MKKLTVALCFMAAVGVTYLWFAGPVPKSTAPEPSTELTVAIESADTPTMAVSDEGLPKGAFSTISEEQINNTVNGSSALTEAVNPDSTLEQSAIEQIDNRLKSEIDSAQMVVEEVAQAYEIGQEALSDAEFNTLVRQLKNDPNMLAALLDEFRSETDPKRLKRLSQLLAEAGSDDITAMASSMLHSGNPASQAAALDLLRRVASEEPAAREVVLDVLSTETNSEVLVSALNVFATPGNVSVQERGQIMSQVSPLLNSDDASVRRSSLNVLSRWNNDDSITPQLIAGLNDSDAKVRQSAAYALVDYPYATPEVKSNLFYVLENPNEQPRARRGAALALNSMSLSEAERQRIAIAEKELNKRR